MKYLSQISAAEIFLLLKGSVSQKALLKITFVDLLLKKVLDSVDVDRQPSSRDEVRTYQYITTGRNSKNYIAQNHEKFFLSVFDHDKLLEVLFRNLVKIGYQQSQSIRNFKNQLLNTKALKPCFSQNLLQKVFCTYSLTTYGSELKQKIEKEIINLNSEIVLYQNSKNQKVMELSLILGGNIFLLDNIDYSFLDQIEGEFPDQTNQKNTDSGCSGCGWTFDNYSDSFDSGCSSDGGGSDGGGCGSGCGGCGGGCS